MFKDVGEHRIGRNRRVAEMQRDLEFSPSYSVSAYRPVVMPEFPDEEFFPRFESLSIAPDELVAAFFRPFRFPPSYLASSKSLRGIICVDPDSRLVVQLEGFILSCNIGDDDPKYQQNS